MNTHDPNDELKVLRDKLSRKREDYKLHVRIAQASLDEAKYKLSGVSESLDEVELLIQKRPKPDAGTTTT